MSFKHRVMLHGAALALSGLLLAAEAHAQTQAKDQDRTVGSGAPGDVQTPLRQRQPQASDLPANLPRDPSDEWLARINRDIDRKLQICRGC